MIFEQGHCEFAPSKLITCLRVLPPTRHSADRLLAHYHENHAADNRLQTANVSIVYPRYAPIQGNVLTHVHLIVYITLGGHANCTIRAGGLRQRNIDLLVTANATEILNYDVQFYGL